MGACSLGVKTTLFNTAHFTCSWKINDGESVQQENDLRYLDLELIQAVPSPDSPVSSFIERPDGHVSLRDNDLPISLLLPLGISGFLQDTVLTSVDREKHEPIIIKFIIPLTEGYITQSNFLDRRLEGIIPHYATRVVSFLSPGQKVNPCTPPSPSSPARELFGLIASSLGAVIPAINYDTAELNLELASRLSTRLGPSTPNPAPHKRLILVEGRRNPGMALRMLEAAFNLGISLVVFDKPGHWLQDDAGPYTHLRESFVSVDIDVDSGFVERVVSAVNELQDSGIEVDGLMTVSDARLVGVAKACEILGLPTGPSTAHELAGDKYATRMMEEGNNDAFRVFSVHDLQQSLPRRDKPLAYPLIVKPCLGWGSQAVSKVSNEEDLLAAVAKAAACHELDPQKRTDVVIEPYIDGPEVDANFVLLDGEILFFELIDDFPSPGDVDDKDSFVETVMMIPSGLPRTEAVAIRDALHKSILRQGFRTGVFHCEARVQYSSMEYRKVKAKDQEDGNVIVQDLCPRAKAGLDGQDARVYLLEVNARPPGYLETVSTQYVYGVDYYAQQMLFAVGSEMEDRFRTLATPFAHMQAATTLAPVVRPQQGTTSIQPQDFALVVIQEGDETGIMKTADPAAELVRRYPDWATRLPLYSSVIKGGDRVFGRLSANVSMMAWFLVTSDRDESCTGGDIASRKGCLVLSDELQRVFPACYELE